jgi:hypothetical protein
MDDPPRMTLEMQLTAWVVAHRALLAFLLKRLDALDPAEATGEARNATASMLRNSIPPIFANQPAAVRNHLVALAAQEIDRILTVPVLDVGPGPRDPAV